MADATPSFPRASTRLRLRRRQQLQRVDLRAVVGDVEDRRLGVGVHGDDQVGALHPFQVLRRAADAQGQIQLGLDGHARLAHLARGRQPALVDHRPRGADRAAQGLGQFLGQLHVVLLLDAASHGHQDVLLRDVHVAGLGQDPLLERDRARPPAARTSVRVSTCALPGSPVGRKLPGMTIRTAGRPVDLDLGHHLAAAERRGDHAARRRRPAIALQPVTSGACSRRGQQRRQVPADRRAADQHGPRLLRRDHFLQAPPGRAPGE